MHNHTGNLLRKKIYVKIPIYSNSILPIFILRHNRAWPRITYNNYRRCNYPDVIARRAEKFNTQWSLWKATLHCFLVLYLVLTCTMRILEFLWLVDRCFGKVNVGILSTIFNNVSLSTFLSPFFFFFPSATIHYIFPGTVRGREKEQHVCYKMMANGKRSPHHSKTNHHINSPVIGSPKHMGTQFPAVRKEGRG